MAVEPSTSALSPSTSSSDTTFATATVIDSTEQALDSRIEESDLDPAAFLKSVRELSEKREREDTERVRKLEEEIEQGRRERARRREERARSISPEKVDAHSARPLSSRDGWERVDSPRPQTRLTPSSSAAMEGDRMPEFSGFGPGNNSSSSTPAQLSDTDRPIQSASSLARSGTLSWQRRPASRGASSRPQSVVLGEGRKEPVIPSREEPEKSREQIAVSLGSRDPSWFKQTAERGVANAAFRKSKDEAGTDNTGFERRGLPGMSRETSVEPRRRGSPAPSESVRSDTTSRPSSVRDSTFSITGYSASRTSTSSKPDLKSLIAADEGQEKASPLSDRTSSVAEGDHSGLARTLPMSSSQARIAEAQERPSSPTKGMGGFVSSAMMKRADSQTKRWSAQPGGSLSRHNSLAGARNGLGGLQGSHSMPRLEPTPSSRETSNEPASQPTSKGNVMAVDTALPGHSRSKSVASTYSTKGEEGHNSPPSSPSKRWSPTKSSWLESSITKPEAPKPASARNSQPDWMQNIAKAKAQRASGETPSKPAEEAGLRSASPTKATFGQAMLKRSESGGLGTPRTLTPKPSGSETPRPLSSGQSVSQKSDSQDFQDQASQNTPLTKLKPSAPVQKSAMPNTKAETVDNPIKQHLDATPTKPALSDASSVDARKIAATMRSPPPVVNKPKPGTTAKPQTDFRSTLRSRSSLEAKQDQQPEFLAKFGQLKKAQTQNYVAPDVLKDNILRGKGDLTKTDGPVKTVRRDELKESLLAKKEQWKKEKDEGVVHERKTSNPPLTPQKPEALARREAMGRAESMKQAAFPTKTVGATPEALARHESLRSNESTSLMTKQQGEPSRQTSTPTPTPSSPVPTPAKQLSATSKLASRFNPGLAGILARGPPASTTNSTEPSLGGEQRMEAPSEPQAEGAALQDMRKGRAKGPKKRRVGAGEACEAKSEPATILAEKPEPATYSPLPTTRKASAAPEPMTDDSIAPKSKPKAPPGSAAALMIASLQKSPPRAEPGTPLKGQSAIWPELSKPAPPAQSPSAAQIKPLAATAKPTLFGARAMQSKPSAPAKTSAVDMGRSAVQVEADLSPRLDKRPSPTNPNSPAIRLVEDDKESLNHAYSPPKRTNAPSQIQLPSRKDEEAAMHSAGLLASSPSRPSSRDGLGIALEKSRPPAQTPPPSAVAPPKPTKPSRIVSGQMVEASPIQGASETLLNHQPSNATEQHIYSVFGCLPRSTDRLSIDTPAVLANQPHQDRTFKTIRKTVQLVSPEGVLRQLPQQQDYTFFDQSCYCISHAYTIRHDGPKKAEIFLWVGSAASSAATDAAQNAAKRLAKTEGNAYNATVRQGFEPPGFLQALGGILITRRGAQEGASKQYMLCGRQHLGQIAFDEVEFASSNLCSGFAYMLSYPVTLQETRLYLWKGSAASPEEISAARLAAMDVSETGEIIEVDERAEFASFLKIFGPQATKATLAQPASELWQIKAQAPSQFFTRLFKLQKAEQKTGGGSGGGMFGSFFTRRPSRNSSASIPSAAAEGFIVEAKEISPLTQSDLEAESLYLLDAYARLFILVGPVFPSKPTRERDSVFAQALLFAAEYAVLAAGGEARPAVPKVEVVLGGVPWEVKALFRFWDEGLCLWGTGGLMAGSGARDALVSVDGDAVREVVCG